MREPSLITKCPLFPDGAHDVVGAGEAGGLAQVFVHGHHHRAEVDGLQGQDAEGGGHRTGGLVVVEHRASGDAPAGDGGEGLGAGHRFNAFPAVVAGVAVEVLGQGVFRVRAEEVARVDRLGLLEGFRAGGPGGLAAIEQAADHAAQPGAHAGAHAAGHAGHRRGADVAAAAIGAGNVQRRRLAAHATHDPLQGRGRHHLPEVCPADAAEADLRGHAPDGGRGHLAHVDQGRFARGRCLSVAHQDGVFRHAPLLLGALKEAALALGRHAGRVRLKLGKEVVALDLDVFGGFAAHHLVAQFAGHLGQDVAHALKDAHELRMGG